jgi:hypothetical protein
VLDSTLYSGVWFPVFSAACGRAALGVPQARASSVVTNQYTSLETRVIGIIVVVKPARAHSDQIAGFAALTGIENSHLVYLRAIQVVGMVIRAM